MTEFPKLEGTQVAILHTDAKTGDVLDAKYMPYTEAGQKLYVVFNSLDEALTHIQKQVRPLGDVEVIVYNAAKETVHYYNPLDVPGKN